MTNYLTSFLGQNLQKAQMNGVNAMFERSPRLRPLTPASDASSQLTAVSTNMEEEVTELAPSRLVFVKQHTASTPVTGADLGVGATPPSIATEINTQAAI